MKISPVPRLGLVLAVAAGIALGVAAPAAAHVTVQGPGATQSSYAAITFRVPTERDDAATTGLVVNLPMNTPLAGVSVKPHPGWTYQVTKAKLATPLVDDDGNKTTEAVSKITWTATGPDSAIKPGEYDEFAISGGPLPAAPQIVFTVLQTYSDGDVVKWIEPRSGDTEPEHPAPVLKLAPAAAQNASATSPSPAAAASTAPEGDSGSAGPGVWLGGAALLVALIAAGLAGAALRRRTGPA